MGYESLQRAYQSVRSLRADDLTGAESELASLRRQLAEARENLRLIQERKSEYVMGTDIPLQLVKQEQELLERIEELEQRVERRGHAVRVGVVEASADQLRSLPLLDFIAPPLPAVSTELPRQLRVFLCHASGDKPTVRDLYRRLRSDGIALWLDEEDLLPGQDWRLEIPKAVRSSDVVIICLSSRAVTKAGYFQKEIKYALDVADEQPEGTIFLIPLRLEECEVPESLGRWQWVDLFREAGYERLLCALGARAKSLGPGTLPFELEMVLVPAGEFLMGSDPARVKRARGNEQPQHTLYLPDYYLAKTPVTNAQYTAFVHATGHELPEHWEGGKLLPGKEDHPVVNVSWYDAVAYCNWLSQVTGKVYCLPSEAEWEKAARGTDGRIYPWGDELPDERRCNFGNIVGRTTAVGRYSPQGDSPYGCADMAGNVWEWTRSRIRESRHVGGERWFEMAFRYPYDPEDGRENPGAGRDVLRVLRGGAFDYAGKLVRCAYRLPHDPSGRLGDIGFRVVAALARINRQGVVGEGPMQPRSSEPDWPPVMRRNG